MLIEEKFKDLLQPIKDPEKSFQVDIAQLLHIYITQFVQGNAVPFNTFNSAALLLQGSSSIYGKKVEYVHNLATQLYQNLIKHKKEDQVKKDTTNKTKEKHKENKFNNPFFSTDFKVGKNLNVQRKRNTAKSTAGKKSQKNVEKKSSFVPVDMLPVEGDEKGEDFYDTNKYLVGKRTEFSLNTCPVCTSSWLIIPTLSPDEIPDKDAPPDYSFAMDFANDCTVDDCDMPAATPDEGVDTASVANTSLTASSQAYTISQQTDEGLGSMSSTPMEPSQPSAEPMESAESSRVNDTGNLLIPSSSNAENATETLPDLSGETPMDGFVEDLDVNSTLPRRSMRKSQRIEEAEKNTSESEIVYSKRVIQKKNNCILPTKLRSPDGTPLRNEEVAQFCARVFFSLDNKLIKNGIIPLEITAFKNNINFLKKLQTYHDKLKEKNSSSKSKKSAEELEQEKENIDIENLNEPDCDDVDMPAPLEDADIVIQNDPNELPIPNGDMIDSNMPSVELSDTAAPPINEDNADAEILPENDSENLKNQLVLEKHAELAARVRAWQDNISPFLNELEKREPFDINLYGSRILNSFEQLNGKQRRQTKSFKDFCKGMEKWQIHRYFMALLPLANIGNVVLELENSSDGEEEILITLISKKMHHLRLEEFGSNTSSTE